VNAACLLETARAAGLSLEVEDGNLVVEADYDLPSELIAELRQHKAELIAELGSSSVPPQRPETERVRDEAADGLWWRDRLAVRSAHWSKLHGWEEAERLAWGEIEGWWLRQHGERLPRHLCAGCRRPIGTAETLDLMDGNHVHLADGHNCLIRHGKRWRAAATRALTAMGLSPPVRDDMP
jgi:hypothetical protein